jgi:hypothetical protein
MPRNSIAQSIVAPEEFLADYKCGRAKNAECARCQSPSAAWPSSGPKPPAPARDPAPDHFRASCRGCSTRYLHLGLQRTTADRRQSRTRRANLLSRRGAQSGWETPGPLADRAGSPTGQCRTSPLDIPPHVSGLDGLGRERNVFHSYHDGAYVEGPPPKHDATLPRDLLDPHDRQIRMGAADREPKIDGPLHSPARMASRHHDLLMRNLTHRNISRIATPPRAPPPCRRTPGPLQLF